MIFSARAGPFRSVARVCTASCRPARSRNGVCVKSYIVASGYARKDNTFSGTFPHLRIRRAPNPFFQRNRHASGTVHNPGPTCKRAGDNVLLSPAAISRSPRRASAGTGNIRFGVSPQPAKIRRTLPDLGPPAAEERPYRTYPDFLCNKPRRTFSFP